MADAVPLVDFYNHLRVTGLLDDLVDDIVAKVHEVPPSREEARLRLTCAALTGIVVRYDDLAEEHARMAVKRADACLALLYPEEPRP